MLTLFLAHVVTNLAAKHKHTIKDIHTCQHISRKWEDLGDKGVHLHKLEEHVLCNAILSTITTVPLAWRCVPFTPEWPRLSACPEYDDNMFNSKPNDGHDLLPPKYGTLYTAL